MGKALAVSDHIRQRKMDFESYFILWNNCRFNGRSDLNELAKIVTGQFSLDMLAGPVGIYDMTGEVAKQGVLTLMQFAAFLSINLGIVNLLPIPALDGGRLLFLFVEAIRGKPINREKEALVVFIGVAFLMLLMLVVTWNDIQRLFYKNHSLLFLIPGNKSF